MKYLGTIEVLDRVGCIFIKILIILFSYFPAVYSPFNLGLPRGNVIKCHPPEVSSNFSLYPILQEKFIQFFLVRTSSKMSILEQNSWSGNTDIKNIVINIQCDRVVR